MYSDYEIVTANTDEALAKGVNVLLKQGYVPIGGMCAYHVGNTLFQSQAVAKPVLMTAMMLNTVPVRKKPKKRKKRKK